MIGSKILQLFIGLVVTSWTARFLGPSNLGTIEYVSSFITFFSCFATLGLEDVIIKELIQYKEREHEVLGSSIILRIFASIACSVVIIILIYLMNPGNVIMIGIAVILSFSLVFNSFEMIRFWYQSKLEAKTSSIIQTLVYIIVSIYRIYCLVTAKNVYWFAAVTTVSSMVTALFLYLSYRKDRAKPLAFNKDLAKTMFLESHHFIYSGLMSAIYGQMDKVMLKEMMDTTAVGYYSTAVGINSIWSFVLSAIIDSINPTIIEAKQAGDEELYHQRIIRLYAVVFYFSAFVSLGITILAKPIILILYGEQYIPSIECLRVATWINTFSYLGVARNAWMVTENNQKYQKYILGLGAIVNLILNALWIPSFGISGATVATLITQIITGVFGTLLFKETRENTLFILKGLNPAVIKQVLDELLWEFKEKLGEIKAPK